MASSSCSLRFPAVGGVLNGSLNQAVAASRLLLPSTSVRVSWNGHQGGGEGRRGILVVRSCDSVAGAVVPPAAPLPSDQSEYFDSKSFRKTLTRSDNYNRSGFGYKNEMLQQMEEEYTSKCEVLISLIAFEVFFWEKKQKRECQARRSLGLREKVWNSWEDQNSRVRFQFDDI
jgi:hypothetical protein